VGEIKRIDRNSRIASAFCMNLPALHPAATQLCDELAAPPLLVRHLTLVHSAAIEVLDGIAASFPTLAVDRDAILFGAATHDLGKTLHTEELTGPGNRHEDDGPALLEKHGVSPNLARFARTHSRWGDCDGLEDLIVALADNVWCGKRVQDLEAKVAASMAAMLEIEGWATWSRVNTLCNEIANRGDERLAWQRQ
jgi:hypothetical protein